MATTTAIVTGVPEIVFNFCLQDESNGNVMQINSTTGDYQFTNCSFSGFTVSGRGTVLVKGSQMTLEDNLTDRQLLVKVDNGVNKGIASLRVFAQGTTLTIQDRDTTNNVCPCTGVLMTREEMALQIVRASGVSSPPTPLGHTFADVPPSRWSFAWIEDLARRRVTLGCGGGNYCPDGLVTREQMAAFIIRSLHEPGYVPPTPRSQRFADVPPINPFYAYIEELAARGITFGCGGGNYCPTSVVTREQMRLFLMRAYGFTMDQ
jgi:hypothetical protein